jgi:small conductance mechanosensitive channel
VPVLQSLVDEIRSFLDLLHLDPGQLLRDGLKLAFIWLLASGLVRIVVLVSRRIERAVDDGDASHLSEAEQRGKTVAQLLRSVGRAAIYVIAGLLSLNVFIEIGPLLAGAGILGLAVSFGAQSLVKDVISGFFYLMEGQFAVGDVIEVAGKSGEVERMTLRVVMLRDGNGALHIIPNGAITTVSNLTRKWSRAVVDVSVSYDGDVDRALGALRDETSRFETDPAWRAKFDGLAEVLGVNSFEDHGATIRTALRTLPGLQWEVAREFRRRVMVRFERDRISMPQRAVELRLPDDSAARRLGGLPDGGTAVTTPSDRPSA